MTIVEKKGGSITSIFYCLLYNFRGSGLTLTAIFFLLPENFHVIASTSAFAELPVEWLHQTKIDPIFKNLAREAH